MSAIKIEQQASYPFKTEIEVRVTDLNYGNHLGYDHLLGLAHQARIELFKVLNADEMNLGDGATGIIVADMGVNYRGEAFLGDVLIFEISAVDIKLGSFRLAHRVKKQDGGNVALMEIGCVAFDYKERKPCKLPQTFKDKLANYTPANRYVD